MQNKLNNTSLEERLLNIAEPLSIMSGDRYLDIAIEKYNEGLNFKLNHPDINYVTIARNGVWSASGDSVFVSSYETIFYHTGSNSFYEGLKDSGIEIRDLRKGDNNI